jgi:hypothetical protein
MSDVKAGVLLSGRDEVLDKNDGGGARGERRGVSERERGRGRGREREREREKRNEGGYATGTRFVPVRA